MSRIIRKTNSLFVDEKEVLESKLVLVDEEDGSEWIIKVKNGELIIEPKDFKRKRDFKIDKVLKK